MSRIQVDQSQLLNIIRGLSRLDDHGSTNYIANKHLYSPHMPSKVRHIHQTLRHFKHAPHVRLKVKDAWVHMHDAPHMREILFAISWVDLNHSLRPYVFCLDLCYKVWCWQLNDIFLTIWIISNTSIWLKLWNLLSRIIKSLDRIIIENNNSRVISSSGHRSMVSNANFM